MRLKPFLCCSSLLILLALPAAAEPLAPRGEVSVKGGTDRSLLTTEFWAPLAQQSDRVLYGDIRLMGDNDENREGNLGLGYRQIKNNAVIGVHGWIDRRRTQHNSTFHQLTFGVERLGHIVDARANIYVPINNGRNVTTRNIGATTPYLAGSGIYYDTNGTINETPQYGLDGELGYRLPILQKQVDAIRVYGGGYYFFRDNTVEVPGIRFRTEAQINKIVSIGARVQYDKPRGTQGFLEATLKFPFSAKRLYQESGIRSRLDESPERDVDIVTESKVTDTGLFKPAINTTSGTQQRILYVDNSKTDHGDGSYEKPFNTLKSAESALQANDILYVNRGDGTAHNMDQGLVIDKANVQLIGSGSALTYNGYTLLNAGAAPVISNTQTRIDDYTGNGIYARGKDISISGITVSGVDGFGIHLRTNDPTENITRIQLNNIEVTNSNRGALWIISAGGARIENIDINNLKTSNIAAGRGAFISADANSFIGNIRFQNTDMSNSQGEGIRIQSNSGIINTINFTKNTTNNNLLHGSYLYAFNNGVINQITTSGGTTSGNAGNGIQILANNGTIRDITIDRVTATGNTGSGISAVINGSASRIDNFTASDNTTSNNSKDGIVAYVDTGGVFGNIQVLRNNASNNLTTSGRGVQIKADGSGSRIGTVTVQDNTLSANAAVGLFFSGTNSAVIGSSTISGNNVNGNGNQGLSVYFSNATLNNVAISGNTVSNNTNSGIRVAANGATGMITTATVSGNTTNNNTQDGLVGFVDGGAKLGSISFTNNVSNNNTTTSGRGLQLRTDGSGSAINNATIANNTLTGNAATGVLISATASSVLSNTTINANQVSNNGNTGILVSSQSSTINNATLSNNTANGNTGYGIRATVTGTNGQVGNMIVSGNTANANTLIGYGFSADAANVLSAKFSGNRATGNTTNGLFVEKLTTGSFIVDAGGGTLSSTGQNSISGNTGTEVRVDGGYALSARTNYWGGGDLVTGEKTLNGGSTVDSTGFLTVTP